MRHRHLTRVDEVDYERAVALYHKDLHRFALSLARNPDDARDLKQESYCGLLGKSGQLRDRTNRRIIAANRATVLADAPAFTARRSTNGTR